MAAPALSIIVPAFNEAESLPAFHANLTAFATQMRNRFGLSCEVVYIDDGSQDATFRVAKALAATALDVQIISFSRNFGKEAALLAGVDHACGQAMLFMDSDGQHPFSVAEELVAQWQAGFDVIYTYKAHRNDDSGAKNLFVKAFYATLNMGLRHKIPENAGDFRLLSPRAVAALKALPERNRFFKGLSGWAGFKQKGIAYTPLVREKGQTKWSFWGLFGLSMEGLTSFSVAPLRLAAFVGAMLALTSLFFALFILFETLYYGGAVPGYPSLFVGMMLIGGVQLLMIGIMGEYIGKILSELKARPVYFIAEKDIMLCEK
jgi:polyisoprenyl-phosphate glycosyltransferase